MGAYEFTYVAPSTVPDCTVVSSPADLTTGIVPNPTVLSWSAAARATSYKLTIGSAAGLSDILSVTGLRALSYNVPRLANTKYFATVIATNNIGDATGCTEISFTIGGWVYCSITSSAPAAIAPITSVDFGGVSNTSDANATTLGRFTAYQDFTSTEFSIANNRTSVPLTITGITTASSGHGWGMSVFIDWNNDGVFAGTEEQYFNTFATKVFVNGSTNNSVTLTGNITIPSGVSLGKKRMRVKYNFQNTDATTLGATLLTACANMVNGQTEDYTINYEIFLPVSNAIKAAVSVYPNPFQDVLKISDIKGVKSISINDVSGRQVKNMKPFSELDLSGLKTGLYIVILHMED